MRLEMTQERPTLLHTNDLASHLFDKMFVLWQGQKYKRYDPFNLYSVGE